jgi:hypothetical protein
MADSKHTTSDSVLSFEEAIRAIVYSDKAHTVPSLFDRAAWPFGWPAEVIDGIRRLAAWLLAQGPQARAFVRDGRQFNYLRWRRLAEMLSWAKAEATVRAFKLICSKHQLALGLDDPLLGATSFREVELAGMVRRFMDQVEDLAGEAWVDIHGLPAHVSENGNSGQPAQPEPASKARALQPPEPEPAEPEQEPVETASGAEAEPELDKQVGERIMRYVRKNERLMRDVRKRWAREGPDLTYDMMESILRSDHSDLRERKGSLKSSLERAVRNLRREDEAERRRASPENPSDSPSTPDNPSRGPSDGPSTLGTDPSDTPF